ncbi:hypothetical protein [Paraburkholderia sacchari]|uniref:hypothetical protein n=1 Tax=Paraburkholderia sacchari TaxID=159450 RepID=UPI003D97D728
MNFSLHQFKEMDIGGMDSGERACYSANYLILNGNFFIGACHLRVDSQWFYRDIESFGFNILTQIIARNIFEWLRFVSSSELCRIDHENTNSCQRSRRIFIHPATTGRPADER